MSARRIGPSYRDEVNVVRPVLAGVVMALVGFGGAFPVVLTGLRPAGRRWITSITADVGLAALGLGAGLATALILLSPPVLVSAVAGLALLGALAAALASAVGEPAEREAAAVTFLVTAAGVTFLGIGAAFWGLLAGAAMTLLHRRRIGRAEHAPTDPR